MEDSYSDEKKEKYGELSIFKKQLSKSTIKILLTPEGLFKTEPIQ